ncbi:hypothetical protein [Paenibacillus sp. BJ-4]|uniref:hypothetical protein n=1 Tax=Paenibacillus sp. BJ-4 TaxID=2878097 RepID=UPI0021F33F7A|nr:hypothetical protein [Paenibacillus sp. BJ-4]
MQYVTLRLAEQGITVSVVELQAAIEKAYLEYKAKTKAVSIAETQLSEDVAQAAAKEAVSGLAAKLNDFLAQATAEVVPVVPAKAQSDPESISASAEAVQAPASTE